MPGNWLMLFLLIAFFPCRYNSCLDAVSGMGMTLVVQGYELA
jgi:hypothetical protein